MTDTGSAPARLPAGRGAIVTVIGESLVDIIVEAGQPAPARVHPGGSPLNVAVGVARLNFSSNLVTHYADDRYGLMIEDHLRSNGITVIRGGSAPTSTATATLGADGAATYEFDISWDPAGVTLPTLAAVKTSSHVHTGSLGALLDPGTRSHLAFLARQGSTQPSVMTPTAGLP